MWPSTHKLDPRRAIASKENPITIQVVALRWKWLFIYPEQKIATVNFVQIPVDTPIEFDLTADETPMSSFWIPQLSGQLYAMTGHTNRLNVMATSKGDYIGKSAEINGAGFAGMKFITHATTRSEFEQWAKEVKTSLNSLDNATYDKLVEPSENNSLAFYNNVDLAIYDKVLMKYGGQHDHVEHK